MRQLAAAAVPVWPLTAQPALSVGGVSLTEIADRFGTPAYVLDEEHVRSRCREYAAAMAPHEVAYAGKAFWCRAMARWIAEEGLSLDACSEGELLVAGAGGFPAGRILLHGNGKTPHELAAALDYGVGRIVVDSPGEVAQLASLAERRQKVLVRVIPDIEADGRAEPACASGNHRFGLSIASGAAADVARRIRRQPALELAGVHCQIGSQVAGLAGFEAAVRSLVAFTASLGGLAELNLGGDLTLPGVSGEHRAGEHRAGGHGAGEHRAGAHGDGEHGGNGHRGNGHGAGGHGAGGHGDGGHDDIVAFARRVTGAVERECTAHGIPMPRITVEPGRAIVGSAGVTLYRVLTVKHGPRPFVVVDGGLSDGPAPAPYGGQHHVQRVGASAADAATPMAVVGRHCEAGAVLVPDALLPGNVRPGDLLAVPGTGAYHHAMASNYNYLTRPPVIAVRDGRGWPLIRRETDEDLLRRDTG